MQLIYGITICLSALLLFCVQPLLAKAMLPLFGGSAFVWVTCILFFQAGLLIGYSYAYLLTRYFSSKTQASIHLIVLCLSFCSIPLHLHLNEFIYTLWGPFGVMALLITSIMLPFMVISSTSPLLQDWYCRLRETEFPYLYYAVSNVGSLIGLLGYPLLLEPFLGLKVQQHLWSWGYGAYIICCLFCMANIWRLPKKPAEKRTYSITYQTAFKWILLTFLSSALLLSITQFLVQNVINLPFMWVLPLALYLISYIVVFARDRSYDRLFWSSAFIVWLVLAIWLVFTHQLAGANVVIVFLSLLFSACMICHGELILIKPPKQALTLFYLFIAFGGVLGGIFANIIALLIFKNWWDFYLPVLLINGVVIVLWRNRGYMYAVLGIGTFILFCAMILNSFFNPKEIVVAKWRNPYGFIRVVDYHFPQAADNYRAIYSGKVMHGMQFEDNGKRHLIRSYYGPASGIALAIEFLRSNTAGLHVGVIGLGCGTLAAVGRKGDEIDFYEIDKDMQDAALHYFTYIKDSPASTRITLGDGRMQLQKQLQTTGSKHFDLMVIDAFTGDAVPSHLMTTQAMELYRAHLAKNGILAFNTSNTYINFLPVTMALANALGCSHYWIENASDLSHGVNAATWALLSCHPQLGAWFAHRGVRFPAQTDVQPLLWTDDYNTILPILRWSSIL